MLNRKSLPGEFWIKIILVLLISFACTAAFISISKRIGRLSTVPTFDDCDYTNRGMFYLYDLKHDGLGAMLRHMGEQRIHSPIAEFQAILAYQLLGVNDDASPYWLNVFRILLYVGAIAWFMRSVPIAPWLLAVMISSQCACCQNDGGRVSSRFILGDLPFVGSIPDGYGREAVYYPARPHNGSIFI